ncbi:c-SKI Smad4 binding domain protein [Opisthorchis viverrini]|uniref:C-SKI Smad4 binding domain protein n=1 Tax=Opisthorchis viverrini TaxID=6198 RepID=A0A1S8X8Q1_OPIVI|nr:c-SKI Smad4 binding domain protein [Opisthorchis viverrini]
MTNPSEQAFISHSTADWPLDFSSSTGKTISVQASTRPNLPEFNDNESSGKASEFGSPNAPILSTPSEQFTTELYEIELRGQRFVCIEMGGEQRLCLAQISSTLLKEYTYNEIHNRRVALGIVCVQCSPAQLEALRESGAMPPSSRRCGTITLREAERLIKSFLDEPEHPKLPDNYVFDVVHHCGWGCYGQFVPARYNSSRAKCVRCNACQTYFSPNKFIFHSHPPQSPQALDSAKYRHPDAANFNAWRRHLFLSQHHPPLNLVHAWEDVKAMFNGGNRKRSLQTSNGDDNLNDGCLTQDSLASFQISILRNDIRQSVPSSERKNCVDFVKHEYVSKVFGPKNCRNKNPRSAVGIDNQAQLVQEGFMFPRKQSRQDINQITSDIQTAVHSTSTPLPMVCYDDFQTNPPSQPCNGLFRGTSGNKTSLFSGQFSSPRESSHQFEMWSSLLENQPPKRHFLPHSDKGWVTLSRHPQEESRKVQKSEDRHSCGDIVDSEYPWTMNFALRFVDSLRKTLSVTDEPRNFCDPTNEQTSRQILEFSEAHCNHRIGERKPIAPASNNQDASHRSSVASVRGTLVEPVHCIGRLLV